MAQADFQSPYDRIFSGRNAWEVMGLKPDSSLADAKSRFKHFVKILHPDVNGGDRKGETQYREVVEAYGIIKNRLEHGTAATAQTQVEIWETVFKDIFSALGRNHASTTEFWMAAAVEVQSIYGRGVMQSFVRGMEDGGAHIAAMSQAVMSATSLPFLGAAAFGNMMMLAQRAMLEAWGFAAPQVGGRDTDNAGSKGLVAFRSDPPKASGGRARDHMNVDVH